MKLTSDQALNLLLANEQDENTSWIAHSKLVGQCCKKMAEHLGLDTDIALMLGYIHDIGRKIDHSKHVIEGYNYLKALGYEEEASICLTHSYLYNDIDCVAGGYDDRNTPYFEFVRDFVKNYNYSIYHKMVNLADLLCTSERIATLEERLEDLHTRKGIHPNTEYHDEAAYYLKSEFELLLGCPLNSIFGEDNKTR